MKKLPTLVGIMIMGIGALPACVALQSLVNSPRPIISNENELIPFGISAFFVVLGLLILLRIRWAKHLLAVGIILLVLVFDFFMLSQGLPRSSTKAALQISTSAVAVTTFGICGVLLLYSRAYRIDDGYTPFKL